MHQLSLNFGSPNIEKALAHLRQVPPLEMTEYVIERVGKRHWQARPIKRTATLGSIIERLEKLL